MKESRIIVNNESNNYHHRRLGLEFHRNSQNV